MAVWNAQLIQQYGGLGPRYTSYPTALQFHEEITPADYRHAVDEGNRERRPLSLYIHIPFCDTVCYYCACNRIITADRSRAVEYLEYLDREMKRRGADVDNQRPVVQIHWGGGTPTYLNDAQITQLVYRTARLFRVLEDDRGDYGIEIDPRTVDQSRLGLLRGLGFNRVSLGVQDLDPRVQQAVNRIQPYEMIADVFDWVRDFGFRSVNADLIYGLPWQSETSLARTIEQLLALRPDRISLFNYAHLPARFKVQRQIVESTLPSPDEKLRMLLRAGQMFRDAGYRFIGMDHFALPEDELAQAQDDGSLQRNFQGYSVHGGADLFAFGVSAISQIGRLYAQNSRDLGQWQSAVGSDESPMQRGYLLTDDDLIRRDLIMRLLCDLRLDVAAFEQRWGIRFGDYFATELERIESMERDGLLTVDGQVIEMTDTGRLLARAVAMIFDRYQETDPARFSRII